MKRIFHGRAFPAFAGAISLLVCPGGVAEGQRNAKFDSSEARKLVERAVISMGGEANLRALKTIRAVGRGYTNRMADADDPKGPYPAETFQEEELRDPVNVQMHRETMAWLVTGEQTNTKTTYSGGASFTTRVFDGKLYPGKLQESKNDWFLLSPEGALIAALGAIDLREEPDSKLNSAPVHVVSFHWHDVPVRLFLNAYNGYLAASEIVTADPYGIATSFWGDVHWRMTYANWELEPGGLHYPLNWARARNGQFDHVLFINRLELNPAVLQEAFVIPQQVVAGPHALYADQLPFGTADRPIQELEPGIVQIPGNWYVTLVRQPDGVVILEAPISAGYSRCVLEEAAKRFPGVPVKAVISSTSSWWHIAGVRQYVAAGIPVYALDQNLDLLQEAVAAQHTIYPDDLAREPKAPVWRIVSARTVIGKGPNRLEIIPARPSTSQMLVTYFPEHHLLYTAELAQPLGPGGSFLFPQDLASVLQIIAEGNLKVDTIIGMHMSPTPLTKLSAAVNAAIRGKTD
jgi:hypothetical protein